MITAPEGLAGHCLCGRVRFHVRGPLRDVCYCHCQSCRRAAGAVMVAWGTVDREDFHLIQGELARVNSSAGVERSFCPDCGSSVTYGHAEHAGEIDIALGVLNDPPAPERHIWVSDKLHWLHIDDDLPQFQTTSSAAD